MKGERSGTFWTAGLTTLAANLTGAGFALAAILAASVGVLLFRSKAGVVTLALATCLVQAGDALIGWGLGDWGKTLGPLVLAAATGTAGAVCVRRRV